MKKAGFWRRFTALLIDLGLIAFSIGKNIKIYHQNFKKGIPSKGKKLMKMTYSDITRQNKLFWFRILTTGMYILIIPAIYDLVVVCMKKGPLAENWSKNFLIKQPKQEIEKSTDQTVPTKTEVKTKTK